MEKYIQWLQCYKIYTEVVQQVHGSQEKNSILPLQYNLTCNNAYFIHKICKLTAEIKYLLLCLVKKTVKQICKNVTAFYTALSNSIIIT